MNQPAVIKGVAEAAGNFAEAAPGHRFNLYFPIWQANWSADNNRKKDAIKDCTRIPRSVAKVLDDLRARQQALFAAYPEGLRIEAISTAPFATGLGNEHPVENGFAFLTPYGLPYLAGSGVKGVLRRAAEELALFPGEYGIAAEAAPTLLDVWWLFGFEGAAGAWWPLTSKEQRDLPEDTKERRGQIRSSFRAHLATLSGRPDLPAWICRAVPPGKDRVRYLADPALFLTDLDDLRQSIHTRGALTFWDVFPKPAKTALTVEIMTPHYTDYYQNGGTPNDAGQPNPIPFLAIPAKSDFDFHVVCEPHYLPDTLRPTWKTLLQGIFTHAFDWLGFGAKTAVGYGVMARAGAPASASGGQTRPSAGGAAVSASTAPAGEHWSGVTLCYTAGNGELSASHQGQQAQVGNPQAQALIATLRAELQARLKSRKELKGCGVDVEKIGSRWRLVAVIAPGG